MFEAFFLVAVGKRIVDSIASTVKSGSYNSKWNRYAQEDLFNKYLIFNRDCPEQEYMNIWELYQLAQSELKRKGYDWNTRWDKFTPNSNSKEFVKGTKAYQTWYERTHHRYGEELYEEDEGINYWYMKQWIEKSLNSSSFKGLSLRQSMEVCAMIYNSPCIVLNELDFDGKHPKVNKYGEPLRWYWDKLPFKLSNNFYPYPTKEQMEEMCRYGMNVSEACDKLIDALLKIK